MDRQVLIDRILETENLTDRLEDDEANTLLNWGIAQVGGLIEGVTDENVAGEKVNGLMHVMRGLNSLAGNPANASHEKIADLLNRYAAMVGSSMKVGEEERHQLSERIAKMQPGEAIQFLTKWLEAKKSQME